MQIPVVKILAWDQTQDPLADCEAVLTTARSLTTSLNMFSSY